MSIAPSLRGAAGAAAVAPSSGSEPAAGGGAAPGPPPVLPPGAPRHSVLEDVQAVVVAAAFLALAYALLGHARLLTGGTSGIALLLARLTPFTFGQIFAVVNLPFFWLAVRQMGWRFTLKTFAAIGLVAVASDQLPLLLRLESVHPAYAAVMGGFLAGMGLLVLARHQACLGGIGILALWLQDRHGLRAGAVQLAADVVILLGSLLFVPLGTLALSILGAVSLNLVLAVNHRPGRYLGT